MVGGCWGDSSGAKWEDTFEPLCIYLIQYVNPLRENGEKSLMILFDYFMQLLKASKSAVTC